MEEENQTEEKKKQDLEKAVWYIERVISSLK